MILDSFGFCWSRVILDVSGFSGFDLVYEVGWVCLFCCFRDFGFWVFLALRVLGNLVWMDGGILILMPLGFLGWVTFSEIFWIFVNFGWLLVLVCRFLVCFGLLCMCLLGFELVALCKL